MGKNNKQEGAVKQGWFDRFLSALERACNKLPPPAILFIYLFVIIAVVSCKDHAVALNSAKYSRLEV